MDECVMLQIHLHKLYEQEQSDMDKLKKRAYDRYSTRTPFTYFACAYIYSFTAGNVFDLKIASEIRDERSCYHISFSTYISLTDISCNI